MNSRPLGLTVIALSLAITPSVRAARPWDEPFSKDTRAMAAAARDVTRPDNPDVIVLLEEHNYLIHADGRTDATVRKVYRVLQKAAIVYWATVQQEYQPWYQQEPEIRARVITEAGEAQWLDPKTIAVAPARQYEFNVFSDSRVVRAPLPSVAAGVVVEYEITVRDKAPLLDAGVTHRIVVSDLVPIERFKAVIDAEVGVTVRIASQLIPESAIRRTDNRGRVHLECDWGPIKPRKHVEYNLPSDIASYPYLSFSTGKSWQGVAERYESTVNQRVQGADLRAALDGVDLKGAPLDVVSRVLARLHKNVRYTGVEFGEAAIVPGTPAETIKRGYGDCKDKATLLVAMLRAAGLKADVALLDAGFTTDVDPDLPGLGAFNHAIVYVASTPPLWIDATATDVRAGFLPSADQGRLALIANRESTALVRTPEAASKDAWIKYNIDVEMSDFGPGTFRESIEAGGGFLESQLRAEYAADDKKLKEQLENYVKFKFRAKSLGAFEVPRGEMNGPFHMTVEALRGATASTGMDDAGVATLPSLLFNRLPWELTLGLDKREATSDEDQEPRQHDFLLPEAYQVEYRYRIVPPSLFKVSNAPASEELKLGPATYTRKFQANADGSFEAVCRFDTGKRRMTASEFEAFRAGLKKHVKRTPELITFVPETSEFLALGQFGKALSLVRDDFERRKESAPAHIRMARILLAAGLGGAALAEAKAATELDPKSSAAWQTLAWAYQHSAFGRRMQGNWDYAASEKALRKAMELDPEDQTARVDLAILLEHNMRGRRYAKDARMEEAIALYRGLAEKAMSPMLLQNLTLALFRSGQLDEAKVEARKTPAEFQALILAVIAAMQEGPAKAIVSAQSSYPDPRQRAIYLARVSATLAQLRQYASAQVVMSAAARLSPELQPHAELMSKLKRWEDTLLPEDDPASPVQRLLLEALRGNLNEEAIRPLVSKRAQVDSRWDQGFTSVRRSLAGAQQALASLSLEEESAVDLLFGLMTFHKSAKVITLPLKTSPQGSQAAPAVPSDKAGEGDPGYRIRPILPGQLLGLTFYLVREEGKYKLLGSSPDGLEPIGELVRELLGKNDIKGAQWWLDEVAGDLEPRADGTGSPAMSGLWSGRTAASRGPNAIRTAAAMLIAEGTGDAKAIQTLREERVKAALALDKSLVDKALCEALLKARKWDDLIVVARRLQGSNTFSEEGFRYFVKAATGARKWKDLETESQKRMEGNALNLAAVRSLVLAKAHLGDTAGALELSAKLSDKLYADAEDCALAAWNAVLAGKVDEAVLTQLKKVKDQTGSHTNYQYTLAMVEAILGSPDDAQQTLLKGMAHEDYFHLSPLAWIAYARICDQYGFPIEAEAAVARAKSGTPDDDMAEWARLLAQKGAAPVQRPQ